MDYHHCVIFTIPRNIQESYRIADQLSNQILVITDEMFEDKQSKLSFTDDFGNKLTINIGECDDWYETILVNGNKVQVWGKPKYEIENETEYNYMLDECK